ncbi:MAG: ABC transporter ATP-binding protein [Muribaculaceae bacterium]|nr:ABC transporter ATP-binding protein [Muribaculaceae bacterium]
MIEINHLTYCYNSSRRKALDNVTVSIGPGIHLLLGANGAGKTTLLRLIAGWLKAKPATAVEIDGIPTAKREPSITGETFMLTDDTQFPMPTINSMVKYHAPFFPNFSIDTLDACMKAFGISPAQPIDTYSLGNRKKAMLAYALSLHTDVLLLDEPTNGLDIPSRQTILELMAQFCGPEQTVIVSTHTVMDLRNLFESVIMLSGSQLLLSTSIYDIEQRVAFVASAEPIPGAIYTRPSLGRIEAIVPVEMAGHPSQIDYSLLFNALQSPSRQALLEILKS